MANTYFQFKQFTIHHDRCAMKVTTDSCLFGAWAAREVQSLQLQNLQLLDVGAGSGLLSLMMAQKNVVIIDAIEIDKEAAHQAEENVGASPWKEHITIITEDVLRWRPTKKYDVIISNPPFYEADLKSDRFTKNVAHHNAGLLLNELLQFIKKHLTTDGVFFLLLPFKRGKDVEELLAVYELHLHKKVTVKQTTEHAPFRLMLQGSNTKAETVVVELSIKDNHQQYTQEFTSILKDYYLHL